jgi:hypothetical protein
MTMASKYGKFAAPDWRAGYHVGVAGGSVLPPRTQNPQLFFDGFAIERRIFERLRKRRAAAKRMRA